jgi:dTDP-4-dehydrorhamnose 3,5-epimerase
VKVIDTELPDVKLIEPKVWGDERGFFYESWSARLFEDAGLEATFVQDNHSRSAAGVLRGLHYQVRQAQGKLVRVVRGAAFDVAVDLRRSSPTFGRWTGVELSEANRLMMWVPPGFAHGFLSLRDGTEFLYKCTDYYAPEHERSLVWSDAAVGIAWPLGGMQPILSAKDQAGTPLAQAETYA